MCEPLDWQQKRTDKLAPISGLLPRMGLEDIKSVLKDWAVLKPEIRRVMMFGSRAKGTNREDSDIDVAVEVISRDGRDPLVLWLDKSKEWRAELDALLPFPLQLEWHESAVRSPLVSAALKEGSLVVYERSA